MLLRPQATAYQFVSGRSPGRANATVRIATRDASQSRSARRCGERGHLAPRGLPGTTDRQWCRTEKGGVHIVWPTLDPWRVGKKRRPAYADGRTFTPRVERRCRGERAAVSFTPEAPRLDRQRRGTVPWWASDSMRWAARVVPPRENRAARHSRQGTRAGHTADPSSVVGRPAHRASLRLRVFSRGLLISGAWSQLQSLWR